ncbi:olfactory receptor 2T8-like [Manis javanica]|uniref:olfactory receptor 2T8-like n=1 Tax=Manis javanica TaxID=9974 RepID=UPI003C6D58D5
MTGAMEKANGTPGVNFIPLGLFNHTPAHRLLFSLVLTIFLSSLLGNGLMILLTFRDPGLHTPMYFLLSQLSLMDLMLAATTVPKMATSYLLGTRSISPAGCGAQIFLFLTLGGGECFLLAAMAYDRYVAICRLLGYAVLMNQRLCLHMSTGSWLLGAADGLMQAAATLSFPYCRSWEINHLFLCDITISSII